MNKKPEFWKEIEALLKTNQNWMNFYFRVSNWFYRFWNRFKPILITLSTTYIFCKCILYFDNESNIWIFKRWFFWWTGCKPSPETGFFSIKRFKRSIIFDNSYIFCKCISYFDNESNIRIFIRWLFCWTGCKPRLETGFFSVRRFTRCIIFDNSFFEIF